jgi:hypothetical protein
VTLRLDKDVIGWFKRQGRGSQNRINAVLRLCRGAEDGKLTGLPAVFPSAHASA